MQNLGFRVEACSMFSLPRASLIVLGLSHKGIAVSRIIYLGRYSCFIIVGNFFEGEEEVALKKLEEFFSSAAKVSCYGVWSLGEDGII